MLVVVEYILWRSTPRRSREIDNIQGRHGYYWRSCEKRRIRSQVLRWARIQSWLLQSISMFEFHRVNFHWAQKTSTAPKWSLRKPLIEKWFQKMLLVTPACATNKQSILSIFDAGMSGGEDLLWLWPNLGGGGAKQSLNFFLVPAFSKKFGSLDGHNLQNSKIRQRSFQEKGYSKLGLRRHASYWAPPPPSPKIYHIF